VFCRLGGVFWIVRGVVALFRSGRLGGVGGPGGRGRVLRRGRGGGGVLRGGVGSVGLD